jgi:hypothetical protein
MLETKDHKSAPPLKIFSKKRKRKSDFPSLLFYFFFPKSKENKILFFEGRKKKLRTGNHAGIFLKKKLTSCEKSHEEIQLGID